MAQAKRARLGTNGNTSIKGFQLSEDNAIALPSGIGTVTAVSTWPFTRKVPAAIEADGCDGSQLRTTIAIGTDSGCIMLMYSDGTTSVLEDSSGTSILQLLAQDSSAPMADEQSVPDIIAGDADGRVSVYVWGRVFSQTTLPAPIASLAPELNPHTPSSFLAGDMSGTIASCHVQETTWKAQLESADACNDTSQRKQMEWLDPAVSSICSVWLPDAHKLLTSYVLAASARGFIQLLAHGTPVHTVTLTAPATSVCSGAFIGYTPDSLAGRHSQAIIGDEAGCLWVLSSFELVPYAQVDYPVTRVLALPLRAFVDQDGPDVVVCATRSDTVYILHQQQVVAMYSPEYWPTAVDAVADFRGLGPALVLAESKPGDSQSGTLHIVSLNAQLD
ncbi:hypothetical protein IWW51_001808 [Coemansia sp. RSA 2702]|nr:hypothetical protein IWW54_002749 [Coemansia sp. RSA 2705]KAJ2327338.1 hypothetical protein IWW51_001808 [Coemansia sp. RSA 2702]